VGGVLGGILKALAAALEGADPPSSLRLALSRDCEWVCTGRLEGEAFCVRACQDPWGKLEAWVWLMSAGFPDRPQLELAGPEDAWKAAGMVYELVRTAAGMEDK
jgi:hypothetical protein